MYAIISELDSASDLAIEAIKKEIMSECMLENPKMRFPLHLSWQGADTYRLGEVENLVQLIARMSAPIEITPDGVGVFTGEYPVLYLTVARSPVLSALNQTLWEALFPLAEGMNPSFSPETWVPHISLVYGDSKSIDAMTCVLQKMIPMQLDLKIKIDELSLVFDRDDKNGTVFRYPLTGQNEPSLDQ